MAERYMKGANFIMWQTGGWKAGIDIYADVKCQNKVSFSQSFKNNTGMLLKAIFR